MTRAAQVFGARSRRRAPRACVVAPLAALALVGCQLFLSPDGDRGASADGGASDAATSESGDAGNVAFGIVEDLATGILEPRQIAVDDDAVYWTSALDGGVSGSVTKVQKDGGLPFTFPVDEHFGQPVALGLDRSHVYVGVNLIDLGGRYQRVQRIAKVGGAPSAYQVSVNSALIDMVVVGGDVVTSGQTSPPQVGWIYATPTDLWSLSSRRTIAEDVADGIQTVQGIAADNDFVYAATGRGIIRVDNAKSGAQSTFAKPTEPDKIAKSLVLASGVLYWIRSGSIERLATSAIGKPPTELVKGTNDLRALAVRGDDLFWADATSRAIWRASAVDGTGATAIATGQDDPVAIAVDDVGAVHWLERAHGAVRRVRLR